MRAMRAMTMAYRRAIDQSIRYCVPGTSPYVQYDKDNNILKHSYRSGEIIETNLGLLNIPEIDLFDEANWLMPVTQNSPEPAAAE